MVVVTLLQHLVTVSQVVARVRSNHMDAFHTAHLEVPGEMFQLAMEAQSKVWW